VTIDPVEKRIGRPATQDGVLGGQAEPPKRLSSLDEGVLGVLNIGRLNVGTNG